jgi:hypothetical protein
MTSPDPSVVLDLAKRLEQAGYQPIVWSYRSFVRPIETNSEELLQRLAELRAVF